MLSYSYSHNNNNNNAIHLFRGVGEPLFFRRRVNNLIWLPLIVFCHEVLFLHFWSDDFEGRNTGILDEKQGVGNAISIKKNLNFDFLISAALLAVCFSFG